MSLRHALVVVLLALPALPLRADREEPGARERERKAVPGVGGARAPRPPDNSLDPGVPELVVPSPTLLDVAPADLRLAPVDRGFLALVPGTSGPVFTIFREDGTQDAPLFSPGHAVDRWWAAPGGRRVAWISGGTLYTAVAGAKAMDSLGAAPVGDLHFSRDGARLVFVRDGAAVVHTFDDRIERVVRVEDGLALGGGAVLSADGKTLYALVGADTPLPDGLSREGAPPADGLAAADLSGPQPVLRRCFESPRSTLRGLLLSPDGASLAFIQSTGRLPQALRLFFPSTGDVRTVARARAIENPAFTADGSHLAFTGQAANGRMQAWIAANEPDAQKGVHVTRQLAQLEGREILCPAPAAGGGFWLLVRDADGKGLRVGRVN